MPLWPTTFAQASLAKNTKDLGVPALLVLLSAIAAIVVLRWVIATIKLDVMHTEILRSIGCVLLLLQGEPHRVWSGFLLTIIY